jgi:Gpi18-like mannosyltransferase
MLGEVNEKLKKNELLKLSLIVLAGLILRIYISNIFYGQSSDEFFNVFATRNTFESHFRIYPHLFMWFYYFISASLLFIIKDAFLAAKIITIFFGLASVPIIYLVTRKIFNEKVALLSSVLLIINPEFTVISSVPLREPVYTFFIFLSLYFAINNKIFLGGFSVGMSFLTRMEGLLIGMPYYIIALFMQETKKKMLKILIVAILFILFILFMNLWIHKPFIYLTETFIGQGIDDPEMFVFVHNTPFQLIPRVYHALSKILKYLFTLLGPNILFLVIGTYLLCKKKIKDSVSAKTFTICYIFHLMFWVTYIFRFGKLPWHFHRYLYPLIPFGTAVLSYGFFKSYEINKIRRYLRLLFIFNIIASYFIYYHNAGKTYLSISASNKELLKAGFWIEQNIPQNAEYKILGDGITIFYLSRYPNKFKIIRWDDILSYSAKPMELDALFNFIKQNNIKYLVWQNDNLSAGQLVPYLISFKEIENKRGKLLPLQKFEKSTFKALIYKFEDKTIN